MHFFSFFLYFQEYPKPKNKRNSSLFFNAEICEILLMNFFSSFFFEKNRKLENDRDFLKNPVQNSSKIGAD